MKYLDASIIIPAFNENENINRVLNELASLEEIELEVIVVVDTESDSTIKSIATGNNQPVRTRCLVQTYGGGPANAIRFGIDAATSTCVVIMMADGSDDAQDIPRMTSLIGRGVVIVSASRYMSGGQQIGGPRIKKFLSRLAGNILFKIAGVGTHDATNSFKAYSKSFIDSITIESRSGFEIGIELVSKAHRLRLPIAEVPTVWLDREMGESRFRLVKWVPKYLKWFINCFGTSRDNSALIINGSKIR